MRSFLLLDNSKKGLSRTNLSDNCLQVLRTMLSSVQFKLTFSVFTVVLCVVLA